MPSAEEIRELDRLMARRLDHYCAHVVKIKAKDGKIKPFIWNREQAYVHSKLEEQKRTTGKVRALVLKARQRGLSTYIGARFYHRTTFNVGQKTFILTHEDAATQSLFSMVSRIHDNMDPIFKHAATADNANQLDFGEIDSGYRVGTAKTKARGRGDTVQNFHGSEVAFWPNDQEHAAGVMQAIADLPGTEIILESTANGVGGYFYDQWLLAEAGQSQFLPIFIPWFWAEDYRKPLRQGFQPSDDELEYAETYKLDPEQVQWMHDKNVDLGGEPGVLCWLFHQEYPATPQLAFQTSGMDSLISADAILTARKADVGEQIHAPVILGVDVARGGGDKTRIIDRQGRKAGKRRDQIIDSRDLMVVADAVAIAITETEARMAFIDITGLGAGVYDRLCQMGFERRVTGINFGSAATEPNKYPNKRCEMWGRMAEWVKDVAGAEIPDSDEWHRHLAAPGYRYDANSRLVLESKEDIKKRLGFSPDVGDALGLTFAEFIDTTEKFDARPAWAKKLASNRPIGGWMAK
jgi:hypothetical protein